MSAAVRDPGDATGKQSEVAAAADVQRYTTGKQSEKAAAGDVQRYTTGKQSEAATAADVQRYTTGKHSEEAAAAAASAAGSLLAHRGAREVAYRRVYAMLAASDDIPVAFRTAVAAAALAPLLSVMPGSGGSALEGAAAFTAELCLHGVISRAGTAAALAAVAAATAIESGCDVGNAAMQTGSGAATALPALCALVDGGAFDMLASNRSCPLPSAVAFNVKRPSDPEANETRLFAPGLNGERSSAFGSNQKTPGEVDVAVKQAMSETKRVLATVAELDCRLGGRARFLAERSLQNIVAAETEAHYMPRDGEAIARESYARGAAVVSSTGGADTAGFSMGRGRGIRRESDHGSGGDGGRGGIALGTIRQLGVEQPISDRRGRGHEGSGGKAIRGIGRGGAGRGIFEVSSRVGRGGEARRPHHVGVGNHAMTRAQVHADAAVDLKVVVAPRGSVAAVERGMRQGWAFWYVGSPVAFSGGGVVSGNKEGGIQHHAHTIRGGSSGGGLSFQSVDNKSVTSLVDGRQLSATESIISGRGGGDVCGWEVPSGSQQRHQRFFTFSPEATPAGSGRFVLCSGGGGLARNFLALEVKGQGSRVKDQGLMFRSRGLRVYSSWLGIRSSGGEVGARRTMFLIWSLVESSV